MRKLMIAGLIGITVSAAAPAGEQETPVIKAMFDCRTQPDEHQRVQCYDAQVDALRLALNKREITIVDRAQLNETRRSLFGFTLPKIALFQGEPGRPTEPALTDLITSIVSVRPASYGMYSLNLKEGGTWETTEDVGLGTPKPGDTVHIKRGPVGGYMANIGGRRAARVRRVN